MTRLRIILAIPVLMIIGFISFHALLKKVPAATIGVRQLRWGGGVEEADYPTGLHMGVSGLHLWHFLPRRTHFVHFIGTAGTKHFRTQADEVENWQPALEIRTKDNNTVVVDVSVPYRIMEGHAYRIVQDRLTLAYRERVKSTVKSVLRAELSNLTSENLQVTSERIRRCEETLPVLNEELNKFHVQAEGILLRQIRFTPEYEAKLQAKQYLRQKARLDEALTFQNNMEKEVNEKEKEIEAEVLKEQREWEKKFQKERSDNEVLIASIESEARVYQEKTKAEGDAEAAIAIAEGKLAVEKSHALRDELRNQALSSRGGRIKLALEAVENLQVESVTLNSDDPSVPMLLDLSQLTRLLVGEPGMGEKDKAVGQVNPK